MPTKHSDAQRLATLLFLRHRPQILYFLTEIFTRPVGRGRAD